MLEWYPMSSVNDCTIKGRNRLNFISLFVSNHLYNLLVMALISYNNIKQMFVIVWWLYAGLVTHNATASYIYW